MNAVIYTRVSTAEQVKGMSLSFQKEDCLRYAREKDITVLHIFEESGESAKFADRPQLLALLEYCRKRRRGVDVLLIWKLDRLSRNQMDYYFIKRTLHAHDIAIHSATEPSIDDSSSVAARVFETFSALQAEIDNMTRRERAIRGMEARMASGIYPRMPPLGYLCAQHRRRGEKKTVPDEPDPATFPLVQRLFRTCLIDGVCGAQELAVRADRWGLRSRAGKRLSRQVVHQMLGNKFYAGVIENPWTGEQVLGKHQSVLSREEFALVQQRRVRKVALAKPRKTEHPDFPLRRTVLCSMCLRPLTGSWSRGSGGRYAYYHCANRCCDVYGKTIPKQELERAFERKLIDLAATPSAREMFEQIVIETWERDQRHSRQASTTHTLRLRDLEKRLDALIGMKERNLVTDEEFLARRRALYGDLDFAKASLARLSPVTEDVPELVRYASTFVGRAHEEWPDMEPDRKRQFQKTVFPDGVPYARGGGFGTARTALIYQLISRSREPRSTLVHLTCQSWNQLVLELESISAQFKNFSPV